MKRLKIVLLVHATLVPPQDLASNQDPRLTKYRTEYDVKRALLALDHDIQVVGLYDDLTPLVEVIEAWRPDIVFNLLEEFAGNPRADYYVVSYLEMMGIPYTGCKPRGLILARDKALSKVLLDHQGIRTPDFKVFPRGVQVRSPASLPYPMVVKSLSHEGSAGISQASYVTNTKQLSRRIGFIHDSLQDDAIAERFIDGRELYISVLGNKRLSVLPFREILFIGAARTARILATHQVKWNPAYRERLGVDYRFTNNLPAGHHRFIESMCKRAFRTLDLNGYVRFDLRLGRDRKVYMLEANPNPAIASNDDFALSAQRTGLDYLQLIQRLINLGLRANRQ